MVCRTLNYKQPVHLYSRRVVAYVASQTFHTTRLKQYNQPKKKSIQEEEHGSSVFVSYCCARPDRIGVGTNKLHRVHREKQHNSLLETIEDVFLTEIAGIVQQF